MVRQKYPLLLLLLLTLFDVSSCSTTMNSSHVEYFTGWRSHTKFANKIQHNIFLLGFCRVPVDVVKSKHRICFHTTLSLSPLGFGIVSVDIHKSKRPVCFHATFSSSFEAIPCPCGSSTSSGLLVSMW